MCAIAGELKRESKGPIPAPVPTRRRELKSGAKERKFLAAGLRSQRWVGGDAMIDFVQSPAWEMTMYAEELVGVEEAMIGMVAKACHSRSGLREKRVVDV
jgi:hypothetical protein